MSCRGVYARGATFSINESRNFSTEKTLRGGMISLFVSTNTATPLLIQLQMEHDGYDAWSSQTLCTWKNLLETTPVDSNDAFLALFACEIACPCSWYERGVPSTKWY